MPRRSQLRVLVIAVATAAATLASLPAQAPAPAPGAVTRTIEGHVVDRRGDGVPALDVLPDRDFRGAGERACDPFELEPGQTCGRDLQLAR